MGPTAAIILAAGKSTRMKSDLPKVLHPVCGRPMLSFVLGACRLAGVDRLFVVVGHGRELVRQAFDSDGEDLTWVHQVEQKGTGHAVLACHSAVGDGFANVLVVAGDMPLIRRETLSELLAARESTGDALAIATTTLEDPSGYGRILRDVNGQLLGICEHRNCTPEQRAIREVNPSYYCFAGDRVFSALERVQPDSASNEIYITEAIRVFREEGERVSAKVSVPAQDAMGINSRLDLAAVGRVMQDRIQASLMSEGVTIVDPDNTWIEANVTIGRDSVVHPFSYIGAGATIGAGCRIGPFAHLSGDETLEDGAVVGGSLANGVVSR